MRFQLLRHRNCWAFRDDGPIANRPQVDNLPHKAKSLGIQPTAAGVGRDPCRLRHRQGRLAAADQYDQ